MASVSLKYKEKKLAVGVVLKSVEKDETVTEEGRRRSLVEKCNFRVRWDWRRFVYIQSTQLSEFLQQYLGVWVE